MDDESELPDIERRLHAALTPPDDVVDRVVKRSLTDEHHKPRSTRFGFVLSAAALAVVISGATTLWWQRMAHRQSVASPMTIVGDGSMLVVTREDGRRWLISPRLDRRAQGHYVIVIPK